MSIWESCRIASRSRKDGERRKGTDQLEVDFVANQVNRGAASKRPLEFVVVRNDTVPWHDEQGILFVGLERFLLDEQAVDLWASFPGRTMGPAALSGGVFGISGTGRGKSRGAFGRGCAPPPQGKAAPGRNRTERGRPGCRTLWERGSRYMSLIQPLRRAAAAMSRPASAREDHRSGFLPSPVPGTPGGISRVLVTAKPEAASPAMAVL